jgi:hypothetical protein
MCCGGVWVAASVVNDSLSCEKWEGSEGKQESRDERSFGYAAPPNWCTPKTCAFGALLCVAMDTQRLSHHIFFLTILSIAFRHHSVLSALQFTHKDDLPAECVIKGVNRYNDILPNPRTRVILEELDGDIGAPSSMIWRWSGGCL